jgi:hypothetical protein
LTVQNPKKGQALTEEEAALSHAQGMPGEAHLALIAVHETMPARKRSVISYMPDGKALGRGGGMIRRRRLPQRRILQRRILKSEQAEGSEEEA